MSEYLHRKDERLFGPIPPDKVEPIIEGGRITGYIFAEGTLEGLPEVSDIVTTPPSTPPASQKAQEITMTDDVRPAPTTVEDQLREAVVWMSGSDDFAPGGKAREGFEKIVLPLLDPARHD